MKKIIAFILCLAMVLGSMSLAFAASKNKATTVKLGSTTGTVTVRNSAGKKQTARADMNLTNGYSVETGADSSAEVKLDDAKAIRINKDSFVEIRKSGKKLEVYLAQGTLDFSVSEKLSGDESMDIRTNTMVTGIRGTEGTMAVEWVSLRSGETIVKGVGDIGGIVLLKAGQTATVNQPFTKVVISDGSTSDTQNGHRSGKITLHGYEGQRTLDKIVFAPADIPTFVEQGDPVFYVNLPNDITYRFEREAGLDIPDGVNEMELVTFYVDDPASLRTTGGGVSFNFWYNNDIIEEITLWNGEEELFFDEAENGYVCFIDSVTSNVTVRMKVVLMNWDEDDTYLAPFLNNPYVIEAVMGDPRD